MDIYITYISSNTFIDVFVDSAGKKQCLQMNVLQSIGNPMRQLSAADETFDLSKWLIV